MPSMRRLSSGRHLVMATLVATASAAAVTLAVTSALAAPKPAAAPTTPATVVDTTPPPAPVLAEKPDATTSNKNAHFRLTDAEAAVTFRCRLDGGAWSACAASSNFNNLDYGEHCLAARAVDGAGNQSPSTTWCWNVVIQGGFPISGSLTGLLAPGVTHPLDLVIGNPYNFAIRVTSVRITVAQATSKQGCAGPANLTVTQGLAVPVDLPRNATRSLQQLGVDQEDWPQLTMPNLATNQDACKDATFSLTYTGEAVKP